MKKLIKTVGLVAILIASSAVFAEMEPVKKPVQFAAVGFNSKGSSDVKQITNEGRPAFVQIAADSGSYSVWEDNKTVFRNYTGITIENCGQTKTLKPGDTVVCPVGSTPIKIASDLESTQAAGRYQIEYP